jgi:hypothetical protein
MLIHSAVITGSVQFNNTDVSGITNVSGFATTASVNALVVKTGSYATTSSVNTLIAVTGSYATTSSVNILQSVTGSYATTSSFTSYTSSNDGKVNAVIAKTGSFATTGSNTFIGTNTFTGSVYITSDLIVQGSSSLQNITASSVSIGTNTVILNTNTPILQFGGISVQDSGSTAGRSGSLLWNSVNDHWINVNPSGSDEGYNSAMVINGPKNTGSLGAEAGLTLNYIPVSQGEDHITDSIIFQSGSTNIGIGTTTPLLVATNRGNLTVNGTSGSILTLGVANGYSGYFYADTTKVELSTNIQPMTFVTNGVERMRITSAGNVGIGTSSPSAQIHIIGNSSSELTSGIKLTRSEQAGQYIVMNYESGIANFTAIDTAFSGPQFRFNTSTNGTTSTERVRITKDGYITLPYQPAFYAYYTAGAGTATTGAFTGFNSTRVNRGSHYNTSNGRFTAPIAGVYEFIFSALWRQGTATGAGEISLGLNGANISARGIGYINFNVGNNGHAQISVKAILSLSANDYVTAWIHVAGTSPSDWYYGENLGYFCGTLIG